MTKRGKKTPHTNSDPANPSNAAPPAVAPEGLPLPSHLEPFRARFLRALLHVYPTPLLAVVLIFVQSHWIEKSQYGEQLDEAGARLLQVRLRNPGGGRVDPVRIVDISSMAPSSPASVTEGASITDRDELKKYLGLVALAGPTAIGIDVIFDPSPDGIVSRKDRDFLDYCLKLTGPRGPIPVRVGIYSTRALGPDRWLGDRRFGELWASILVPSEGPKLPTTSMIKHFAVKVGTGTVGADSLSYSLFKVVRNKATDVCADACAAAGVSRRKFGVCLHCHGPWLFADSQPIETKVVQANWFLIDFGRLQEMIDRRIPAKNIASHLPDRDTNCDSNSNKDPNPKCDLVNKVVMIGRATPGQAFDSFVTTASSLSNDPIPGVYLHAAAVETLMEAPLFALSSLGRVVIDLVLLLCLTVIALFIHLVFLERKSAFENKVRVSLEVIVPAFLAAAVLAVGVLGVDRTGIYWTDFFVVAFVQLFHTPLEMGCHIVWEVVQKSPGLLWSKT